MSYIEEFEKELRKKLETKEPADAIVSWCREKILESYRNGASALRARTRSARKDSKEEKKESVQSDKESIQPSE
jgi:hypothetical protein